MPSDHVAASKAAIKAGRNHYSNKRFKPALEQFTRAMKGCPCARGMKRERCSCKDYEAVASKDGCIFKEAMYNCHCSVGKTFNKCLNELHIQALDYRAATFEALQELDRAKRDAEWMLELAPRLPDGYLRLGKIVRLQKNNEYAWKIYSAGIDAANTNSVTDSPKLKRLYDARHPLHIRFSRKDPIQLPAEIIQWIFSYIELGTLTQCLRVSKAWKNALTGRGSERLWRVLRFTNSQIRRPPRLDNVRKLVSRSRNDVRGIIIENCRRFCLSQPKLLALLNGTKRLEHLELSVPFEPLSLPDLPRLFSNLTSLVLDGFEDQEGGTLDSPQYKHSFLKQCAETLEHLHLVGVPLIWVDPMRLPQMSKLKILRLEQKSPTNQTSVAILQLAVQTPNLEQLWLDKVHLDARGTWISQWDCLWKSLKSVFIGYTLTPNAQLLSAVSLLTSANCANTLQYIDISLHWDGVDREGTGNGFPGILDDMTAARVEGIDMQKPPDYKDLRSFRTNDMVLKPLRVQRLLKDPISQYNKLHTFDINFPLDSLNSRIGVASIEHLKAYSWLRGATSIRCMGVHGFRFASHPRDDTDMPLPPFFASFPNLETLQINSPEYEEKEFCTVVEAILRVTNLKTIYQSQVKGTMLDTLRKLAEARGVELIWGERPRRWPMLLEE